MRVMCSLVMYGQADAGIQRGNDGVTTGGALTVRRSQ